MSNSADHPKGVAHARAVWLRWTKEPAEAFRAFALYRDMPALERTIDAAYLRHWDNEHKSTRKKRGRKAGERRPEKASGQWSVWASKYQWVERAKAYDDHNADIREQARQKALADEAEKWERRRAAIRERDYELGDALRGRATALVDATFDTVTPSAVARMAEAGSKLTRLAAGMETDHQKLSGAIAVIDVDLSAKTEDELNAYLIQLIGVASIVAGLSAPGGAARTSNPGGAA